MQEEEALRQKIIDCCLRTNREGINQGTSGNISARWQEGLLITPSGIPYEALAPADIVYLPLEEGAAPEGHRAPSSEWRFHRDILADRPEVGAVVHSHSTYATALAVLGLEIPAHHYMVAISGGDSIRCADYATFGSAELSRNALAALAGRSCCLLANHGVIATGPNLDKALWAAGEVENLARVYHLARQIGEPRLLDRDEMARVLDKFESYGPRQN